MTAEPTVYDSEEKMKKEQNNNTIALVTGANRGIGFATVKELLTLGYTVILTSRNENNGHKAVSKLEKYGD